MTWELAILIYVSLAYAVSLPLVIIATHALTKRGRE